MEDPDTQAEKGGEKDPTYLDLRSTVRPYEANDLDRLFRDMAAESGKPWTAEKFGAAAAELGTHAPKMISTGLKGEILPPLSLSGGRGNRPEPLFHSGNAALGSYAKVLLRPIAILGQPGEENFVERLVSGDSMAGPLRRAFAGVFGQDALIAVEDALRRRHEADRADRLWHENFPIFFAPGPDGADRQITPLAPVEAADRMRRLRRFRIDTHNEARKQEIARREAEAKAARREGRDEDPYRPIPPAGDFSQTEISGKMRNVALKMHDKRSRFFVSLPEMMSQDRSEIYKWCQGGAFPRMRDAEAALMIQAYARRVAGRETNPDSYQNAAMRKGVEALARSIVERVEDFIDAVIADAKTAAGDTDWEPARPSVRQVLAKAHVKACDPARMNLSRRDLMEPRDVQRVLSQAQFQYAIDQASGAPARSSEADSGAKEASA